TDYGGSELDDHVAATHDFALAGLRARARYHARVRVRAAGGETATSGDFVFSTVVTGVPGATPGARDTFDLGLYGVNTPEDLRRAAESPFDRHQNYQLSSIANNSTDDARRYLDVAHAVGVTVL